MSGVPHLALQWADWLDLFLHYALLSLLSVGGAITMVPEMHRYLVEQLHWLSEGQFNSSIAIAQAAPGPNLLFVALMGWNIGLNAGSIGTAMLGALMTMAGIVIPSSTLAYLAASWGNRNRDLRIVRAFKQGMAPLVISLLGATGWILASAHKDPVKDWPLWLLTAATAMIAWRTRYIYCGCSPPVPCLAGLAGSDATPDVQSTLIFISPMHPSSGTLQ